MRTRLLVGACVVAALVVAVLWWRAGRGDGDSRATGGRESATTLAPRSPRVPAKPASLAGRVTRASDGASVAGAIVMLAGQHPSWAESAAPVVATTDGDGRWRAGAVAPGSYTLTVAAAGFLPHTRDLMPTTAGEERIGVDVALAAGGGLVAGTITTADRAPVANARVRAYRDREQPSFVAISDGAGRYQLGLAPGSYQLEVTHDDHRTAWKNVRAADEPTTADVVLVRGGVVRGVVVAGDLGEPVPYAIVTTGGSTAERADALVVTAVRPGSPAARAGLADGASITAIEGKAVAAIGLERAQRLLTSASVGVGRVLTLTLRGGERATLTAVAW